MKERPILFTGEMVRAILDGRKTQTRRPVKPQPVFVASPWVPFSTPDADPKGIIKSPFGEPGDRLWVRETWAPHCEIPYAAIYRCDRGGDYQDTVTQNFLWRPSIHMPRWASRIDLEITAVRVERVQDITEEDAKKEGVESGIWEREAQLLAGATDVDDEELVSFRDGFGFLWQSIYGNLDANPWVWVYEFRRVKP